MTINTSRPSKCSPEEQSILARFATSTRRAARQRVEAISNRPFAFPAL
jgi:hypothetical protein